MNPEQQEFERLCRLLALKRHEQPPPGFFHSFSSDVVARIRAGERGEDRLGFINQIPWLQRLSSLFEQRPALAGTFGLAVCGLLVWGVAFSDTSPGTVDVPESSPARLSVLAQVPDRSVGLQVSDRSDQERRFLAGFSSTNGGILPPSSRPSLFNELQPVHALPAGWHVPGN